MKAILRLLYCILLLLIVLFINIMVIPIFAFVELMYFGLFLMSITIAIVFIVILSLFEGKA